VRPADRHGLIKRLPGNRDRPCLALTPPGRATVNTLAALIGSAVPVPGGAGVVEAGLIAGLTAAGIPEEQAVAAVLIQRFFAAYLPPVWGWFTLTWMRRREYV
jgi:Lysylphosphatidylglycerol synthase TM region